LNSFSALPRLARCPASGALPHANSETKFASRGTDIHRFIERVPTIGRDAALAEVVDPEVRLLCEQIDLELLPVDPQAYAAEVALAINRVTGGARELGRGLNRQYGEIDPNEVPGTIDIGALVDSDAAYVGDLKTGWSHYRYTPPAATNRQLHAGALALARLHNRSRAIVEIIHLNEDGAIWKDRAELDAFDLDQVEEAIREDLVRVDRAKAVIAGGGQPDVTTGPWCHFCPARAACPAQTGLVRVLGTAPDSFKVPDQLTPDVAQAAYRKLKLAKEVISEVESKLKAFARENPIPLEEGILYGGVPTTVEELDGAVAFEVLARTYGVEVAKTGAELEATKKSIDRAVRRIYEDLKAKGEKVTIRALNETALEAIRKAGGVTTRTRVDVKEHRPRQQ
jgi:RecB family exonuclease